MAPQLSERTRSPEDAPVPGAVSTEQGRLHHAKAGRVGAFDPYLGTASRCHVTEAWPFRAAIKRFKCTVSSPPKRTVLTIV